MHKTLYIFNFNDMRKFILKSFLIAAPFFISYFFYYLNFNNINKNTFPHRGLSRIGNINIESSFFSIYPELELDSIYYDSPLKFNKTNYKILNIGDSFSRQEIKNINGYNNYLAKNNSLFNLAYVSSPVVSLKELLNTNILDSLKIEYVILQSVERLFLDRILKTNEISSPQGFQKLLKKEKRGQQLAKDFYLETTTLKSFFSKTTLEYFYNYLLKQNKNSQVLSLKTRDLLFSTSNNDLFFFTDDVKNLDVKNNKRRIVSANEELNKISLKLKAKGIDLIVLIVPDKYDFYYEDILNNPYPKPIFYSVFDNLEKEYLYFNPKKHLATRKDSVKDLYFVDDTHWSPISSKIIAEKISTLIK